MPVYEEHLLHDSFYIEKILNTFATNPHLNILNDSYYTPAGRQAHQLGCPKIVLDHVCVCVCIYIYIYDRTVPDK